MALYYHKVALEQSTKEQSLIVTKMAEEAQVERNQITMSKSERGQEDQGEKTRVHFDDVLKELGEFGPYQRKIYFILFLPTIFCAMHKLAWVFMGAKVNHRCRLEGEPDNSTYDNWEGTTIQPRFGLVTDLQS